MPQLWRPPTHEKLQKARRDCLASTIWRHHFSSAPVRDIMLRFIISSLLLPPSVESRVSVFSFALSDHKASHICISPSLPLSLCVSFVCNNNNNNGCSLSRTFSWRTVFQVQVQVLCNIDTFSSSMTLCLLLTHFMPRLVCVTDTYNKRDQQKLFICKNWLDTPQRGYSIYRDGHDNIA